MIMSCSNIDSRKLWTPRIGHVIVLFSFLLLLTCWWQVMFEKTVLSEQSVIDFSPIMDFPNRRASPPSEWLKLDNQTCLSEGLSQYPREGSLQRKTPHAIIIGSMKSGTTALSQYLYQHPHVVKPKHHKELHFFDHSYQAAEDGIHRRYARAHLLYSFYRLLGAALNSTPPAAAIDDTPRYMFWSDRIPARILCVAPWAKIVAILRNPIDRAYSHHNMLMAAKDNHEQQFPTFEQWIAMDMQLLKETGVIQNKQDVKGEAVAWKNYTRTGTHGPIGRGLYAIQLQHWFRAYETIGKSRSDFHIIQSERMRMDKNGVYNEVLEFLELEQFDLVAENEPHSRRYEAPMKTETREMLEKFYEPYNLELYKLLGKEWDGVWDP